MSKVCMVARNEKRKRLAKKYEKKRQELKEAGDFEGLQKLPRNSAPTRIRNRCSVTGRSRSVYRKFGVCRHVFRDLASEGKIPGVRKASW